MKHLSFILILSFLIINLAQGNTMANPQHHLKDEIKLQDSGKTVKVLSQGTYKVIGLGFKTGQILEKHLTPTTAFLIIQKGKIEFKMANETFILNEGDYFEIPANVEHELKGIEESLLYLIK